jgi:hypothetical protein
VRFKLPTSQSSLPASKHISIVSISSQTESSHQQLTQQSPAQSSLPTNAFTSFTQRSLFVPTTTANMQFTITTIVALFAAATMAAPSAAVVDASLVVRDTSAVSALQAQAESFLAAKEAAGCSKLSMLSPLRYT